MMIKYLMGFDSVNEITGLYGKDAEKRDDWIDGDEFY